jgi:DNA polymerase-3 subunit delta'
MLPNTLKNLGHATIITGNRQANLEWLKNALKEDGVQVEGNSDMYVFNQESLKIDQLRDEVIAFLNNQKFSKKRFVIISVDQFGFEAQNAFLKNLEEPAEGTHIILLISDEKKLLPTILSRSQIVHGDQSASESRLDPAEFLKGNLSERFAYVESWTKSKKDEDNASKSEVINFMDHLEKFLWDKGNKNETLFLDIRKMKEYANIRGASHRVLLDYLGMICPIIK